MNEMDSQARLESLLGFLDSDPDNPVLLADGARTALAAEQPEIAAQLFSKLDQVAPLGGAEANQAGLAAMRSGDQQGAQTFFERALLDCAPGESQGLRFNLAWSRALEKDFRRAAEALDAEMIEALPQAALLDLQIAHQIGDFDSARSKMEQYLAHHPDYPPLLAAASVLAMDLDLPDEARQLAGRAGDHPDALTTLAALALAGHDRETARQGFTAGLRPGRDNPRAEIGLGLVAMAEGEWTEACVRLDRGAELFGDHLGSWIAAGWAHVLAGDLAGARARFETAVQLDGSFAEAQGSLAVIEVLEGASAAARRRIEVASRLDRSSFSTVMAKILLESSAGNRERAAQMFDKAIREAALPDGSTLFDALARISTRA